MLREAIYNLYEIPFKAEKSLRLSSLGHECERHLWYKLHGMEEPSIPGRIGRLFERGKREEEWIINDLRRAGFLLKNQQKEVELGGIKGHIDAVILINNEECLLELKSCNLSAYNSYKKKGLFETNEMYFYQMQGYLDGLKLKKGIFLASCKDNDEIYEEEVLHNSMASHRLIYKAHKIIETILPPDRISNSIMYKTCGFCNFRKICHER